MPTNHLICYRPLLLLPSIFPSIRVFSSDLALRIRWPKSWSFSFSISPSSEYSGLISFRIDWLNLLAVQGTLKSLLQHHKSRHQFLDAHLPFMVQLSHACLTIGETIAFMPFFILIERINYDVCCYYDTVHEISAIFYGTENFLHLCLSISKFTVHKREN